MSESATTGLPALAGNRLRGGSRKPLGETPVAWLLLAPVLVLFAIAVVFPLIDTIRLSFYDIRGLSKPKWVGLGNYLRLATDPAFRNTLMATLTFTLGVTIMAVGVGWLVAMLCAFAPRQTVAFRVMIFSAFGISEGVVGFMWITMLRPDAGGLVNAAIQALGFPGFAQPWLGDPDTAIWAMIVAGGWAVAGLPLMLCFASVQAIPKSLIEAAYMDGARPMSMMRHIMMPLSMPGVRVSVFITLLNALRAFDIIYVMTGGGPVRSTETVGYFMYRESMTQFKLGYGAAATVILLIAVLAISLPAILQRTRGAR
jgi:raffinose/stachyose/melibiose transport system permease protein